MEFLEAGSQCLEQPLIHNRTCVYCELPPILISAAAAADSGTLRGSLIADISGQSRRITTILNPCYGRVCINLFRTIRSRNYRGFALSSMSLLPRFVFQLADPALDPATTIPECGSRSSVSSLETGSFLRQGLTVLLNGISGSFAALRCFEHGML